MLKHHQEHVIPPRDIRKIIRNADEFRTRALITFQFFFGRRAGELAKTYKHKSKKKRQRKYRYKYTNGIKMNAIRENIQEYIIPIPNFKNAKMPKVQGLLPKNSTFDREQFLINIIKRQIELKRNDRFLFDISERRVRQLIDGELKKYNENYSTHWLRHSRCTDLAEYYNWTAKQIQEFIGHADLNTTANYTHVQVKKAIYESFGKKEDRSEFRRL